MKTTNAKTTHAATKRTATKPAATKRTTTKPAAAKHEAPKHAAAKHNEPKHAAAKHDEPKHAAAKHDEPKHTAAKHDEPKHAAAKHDEPKHAAAKHDEPKHAAANKEISEQVIDCLNDLIQLDIDAVEAYEQALKNITTKVIHTKINSFKNDHKEHIHSLSAVVKAAGFDPTSPGKDFKGFIIKGMTAIQSMWSEVSALKAMKTNEELTNEVYAQALKESLPLKIKTLVEKNYQDEKKHLEYIEKTIAELQEDK